MATAISIVNRAMRLLQIKEAGAALDAEMAQDCMAVLNAILSELYHADVGFPDYSLSSLTDALATDAGDSEALAHELAARMAPEFGRALSPAIAAQRLESMHRLRLRYFQPGCVDFTELPNPVSTFDINTGDL